MFSTAIRIAMIAQSAASQVAASQERERIRLGLPPPPPKSPEEIARLDKLSKEGDRLMIAWFIVSAVAFASFWTALIYIAIKIAFASQGLKFP